MNPKCSECGKEMKLIEFIGDIGKIFGCKTKGCFLEIDKDKAEVKNGN